MWPPGAAIVSAASTTAGARTMAQAAPSNLLGAHPRRSALEAEATNRQQQVVQKIGAS